MTLSEFSYLATISAAVVFLFAAMLHAVEWASVGVRRQQKQVQERERTLVTAGVGGDALAPSADSAVEEPDPVEQPDAEQLAAQQVKAGDSPKDVTDARSDQINETPEQRSNRFGAMALALTFIATGLIAAGVVTRGVSANRLPLGNMYEFCSTAMLVVAVVYLVLNLKLGMRFLGLPTTLLLTLTLGATVTWFYVDVVPLVPALHSIWFNFHISAAAICAAAFNVAAVVSILYLIKRRAESRGPVTGYLAKIPSTTTLDRIAYWSIAFAFPLWTFTVTAGAIWAQYAWGRFWGWDPKETWALVTWVIYACYLHARLTAGWRTVLPAVIAIVGAVSFWFNFVGINLLVSGLHSYAK